jgi:hypothetical protein
MRVALAIIALTLAGSAIGQSSRPAPSPSPGDNSSTVAGRSYQGEELACDLPGSQQFKNIGSKKDGAGMCVFTSIEMAARWHGMESFRGFRDWCAEKYAGGGYPGNVDEHIASYCKAKSIAVPLYVQYEGADVGAVLDLCDKTGRMACMTYGWSPRYGSTIAHMTCCPKHSGKFAVCLDNNFPGEQTYEWMSLAELERRVKHPSGSGWVFVWLAPSPPPVPK